MEGGGYFSWCRHQVVRASARLSFANPAYSHPKVALSLALRLAVPQRHLGHSSYLCCTYFSLVGDKPLRTSIQGHPLRSRFNWSPSRGGSFDHQSRIRTLAIHVAIQLVILFNTPHCRLPHETLEVVETQAAHRIISRHRYRRAARRWATHPPHYHQPPEEPPHYSLQTSKLKNPSSTSLKFHRLRPRHPKCPSVSPYQILTPPYEPKTLSLS